MVLFSTIGSQTAFAQAAMNIAMSFNPTAIAVGDTSELTFTVTNPNAVPATTVRFSYTRPTGIQLITQVGGTCSTLATGGGSFSINPGAGTFTSTSTVLAGFQSCDIIVRVRGLFAGVFVNNSSTVTSTGNPPGGPASATLIVGGAGAGTTTTTLTSSLNPSNSGQAVTFTALVTGSGSTPTGTVTFFDGGVAIGTATLAGGSASFTTSALAVGAHTMTANYAGGGGFDPSTSAALVQFVGQNSLDSVRLRALQRAVTKIEALASGDAFASAVGGAIAEGFAEGGGALMTQNGTGLRFNLAARPSGAGDLARIREQYAALPPNAGQNARSDVLPFGMGAASGSDLGATNLAAVPPGPVERNDWLVWADLRATGWNTNGSAGDIDGGQVNAFVGVTRKVTPDLLVGVLAGFEHFDYSSDDLNGNLKGNGWTIGGYLGWRPWSSIRFDAALGRSQVNYDGKSGSAEGSFPGSRWLATAGVSGLYETPWFRIEPSAKMYGVWEHDDSYTDTLGTGQGEHGFSAGRASGGARFARPFAVDPTTTLTPYVGVYADYYFSSDSDESPLLPTSFVEGWAGRVTAGITYNVAGGLKFSLGAELGGLGSDDFTTWSVRSRVALPF